MNTALIISLFAVAMGVMTVFIALYAAKMKQNGNRDGSGAVATDTGGGDCSAGDAGGCDGGSGGGD